MWRHPIIQKWIVSWKHSLISKESIKKEIGLKWTISMGLSFVVPMMTMCIRYLVLYSGHKVRYLDHHDKKQSKIESTLSKVPFIRKSSLSFLQRCQKWNVLRSRTSCVRALWRHLSILVGWFYPQVQRLLQNRMGLYQGCQLFPFCQIV